LCLPCLLVLVLPPAVFGQESEPAAAPIAEVNEPAADAAIQPDPLEAGDLQFTFRHAPWEEVLEWLAGEAGLSFSPDVIPTGTFNYIDEDRTFTTEEAIDLVNSYLLIKGYTLVRKGKMLLVIDLEDEVDAQLVRDLLTETPLSELDRRGDYEITKTRFVVDKVDAAEAEKQINQLLSPVGSIVVMPKAKQILVTETGGTLRMMREILKTLETTAAEEESGKLHMYSLSVASADEVLMVARPLLGIPEDGSAAEDGSIRISADPLGRTVFATGTPEKIRLVEQVVKSLDTRSTTAGSTDPAEAPQFMSHPVSSTTPEAVLRVLQTLFVGDPVIRLEIDTATGGILAYAKAAQHRAIKATIAEMEQNPERVEVMALQKTDPAVATLLIEKLFAGVQKPPVVDGTLDPPQLAIRGTQAQIEQIRELLDSLGEGRDATSTRSVIDRGNMRIVPMDPETARAVAERIQGIWPSLRQNPIRVLVPSRPSALQMSRPDESSPDEPFMQGERMFPGRRPPRGGEMDRPMRPEGNRRPTDSNRPYNEAQRPPDDQPVRTTRQSTATVSLLPVSYLAAEPADPAAEEDAAEDVASDQSSADSLDAADPAVVADPDEPDEEEAEQRAVADEDGSDEVAEPAEGAQPSASEPSSSKPPAEIIITATPQGLMITSEDPDALDTIQSLVEVFASQEASGLPQFNLFYLKHVEAETARTLITSILTGVTGTSTSGMTVGSATSSGSPGSGALGSLSQNRPSSSTSTSFTTLPHIVADKRLNALFVNGTPEQVALVKQLLEVVDTESGPEEVLTFPRPQFIPVYHTKAETVATVLRQVYANRLETGPTNNRGQQDPRQMMGFPPGFAERFGGRGGGDRGDNRSSSGQSAAGDLPKMTIGVDEESNAVIVSAQGPLLKEVESVVAELDRRAMNKPAENIAVVTLKRTNPQLVREAIANVLGDSVEVTQSSGGVTNSNSSSSSRGSSRSSSRSSSTSPFGQGGFMPPFMQGRGGFGGGGFGGGGFGGNSGNRGGSSSGRTSGRGSR
jgi:type II secretory pathway component GspD/PulD (secretin)